MANKMLIDASHPEETRVVVLRGNRVEEFDFEAASKKQLRGNIYLAKVMRVEPSLQAAFVDYGGNRHGFLAFSEIHPDYYQIPIADRQALIEEESRAQRDEEEDASRPPRRSRRYRRGEHNGSRAEKRRGPDPTLSETLAEPYAGEAAWDAAGGLRPEAESEEAGIEPFEGAAAAGARSVAPPEESAVQGSIAQADSIPESGPPNSAAEGPFVDAAAETAVVFAGDDIGPAAKSEHSETAFASEGALPMNAATPESREPGGDIGAEGEDEAAEIEQLGGDAMEEMPARSHRQRRQYKIQEVIKRRQVLLVQVVKEERGNKGAALTTYLSLAGRYSVLMPNTARGGGISRKITDSTDRQRLKSIAQELEVPEGMGVIVRTAGAARTKAEVKRDFEYLLRMWETVRETTLQSSAPTLVYEEGSLIKRSIRDLYNKDIDAIVVAGEDAYREAKEFMRLLMPSHAKVVQSYRDPEPMFAKSGAEAQLDAMFSNQVTLKSGGYVVINQTEALVAIDVNSGRSTREHNIEDTALRTNLEAADEISRQLRLRDLAGLIVIDFIDMEENRNNRAVERRLKDALKNDRARIQIGRLSHFGLLEMSRQRMRTGVIEGSTVVCSHCAGSGMIRSTASIALHVLRVLEDALIKNSSYDLIVTTRTPVALYILNQKRAHLRDLEKRFRASLTIAADDAVTGMNYYTLERGEPAAGAKKLPAFAPEEAPREAMADRFFDESADTKEGLPEGGPVAKTRDGGAEPSDGENEADGRQRRRRRRRRGRGDDRESSGIAANAPQPPDDALEAMAQIGGLRRSVSLESEAEIGQAPLTGNDETEVRHRDGRRRSRRDGRVPHKTSGNLAAGPADAAEFEIKPERNALGGSVGEEGAGRARRGRRVPRSPRASRGSEAGVVPNAASAFATDDRQVHAKSVAPQGDDVEASPASAKADVREAPQSAPTDGDSARWQDEIPSRLEESSPTDTLDPGRTKRSGWWQRARASSRG